MQRDAARQHHCVWLEIEEGRKSSEKWNHWVASGVLGRSQSIWVGQSVWCGKCIVRELWCVCMLAMLETWPLDHQLKHNCIPATCRDEHYGGCSCMVQSWLLEHSKQLLGFQHILNQYFQFVMQNLHHDSDGCGWAVPLSHWCSTWGGMPSYL